MYILITPSNYKELGELVHMNLVRHCDNIYAIKYEPEEEAFWRTPWHLLHIAHVPAHLTEVSLSELKEAVFTHSLNK